MPNELKPQFAEQVTCSAKAELAESDVMKALDILDKMAFFQGQRAGRELWFEKPFDVQEQDIADFSQGIEFVKNIIADADAFALIREMKKQIRKLEDDVENFKSIAEYQQNCNVNRYHIIKEKNAEIERLHGTLAEVNRLATEVRNDLPKAYAEAQRKAITEFAERAKRRLPIISPSVFDQIAEEMKGE